MEKCSRAHSRLKTHWWHTSKHCQTRTFMLVPAVQQRWKKLITQVLVQGEVWSVKRWRISRSRWQCANIWLPVQLPIWLKNAKGSCKLCHSGHQVLTQIHIWLGCSGVFAPAPICFLGFCTWFWWTGAVHQTGILTRWEGKTNLVWFGLVSSQTSLVWFYLVSSFLFGPRFQDPHAKQWEPNATKLP